MKPEEQRIAIAEACGYKWVENVRVRSNSQSGAWCSADGWCNPKTKEISDDVCDLPNYLNNLNAMHEAFLSLPTGSHITFGRHLQEVCGEGLVGYVSCYPEDFAGLARIAHATAAQRAEAFIRTIGKWNSDKINKTLE